MSRRLLLTIGYTPAGCVSCHSATNYTPPHAEACSTATATLPCRDTFAGGIGSHITHSELQALFDVIGTPSWADAASVTTPAWRHYLQVCS
jgi:hypothetical protein